MLCRGRIFERESKRGTVPVYLNVYDLTPYNGYAYWVGLGVYHSGVQVHGVEYAFGAHEFPTTGIFEGEPKQCEGFTFRKTILIGKTDMGPAQVRSVMEELSQQYKGNAYNLITKNCNHFCNDACLKITGNPIPSWVNRLARIGFLCNCVLPATLCSTKVRHHKVEEKAAPEEEKTKLRSSSSGEGTSANSNNKLTTSTCCSSSSSSSPSSSRGRSRTRTRRPQPPSSSPLINNTSPS